MTINNPTLKDPQDFWTRFLIDLAEKTRSSLGSSRKLSRAISNATTRPEIFITLGIHGNILYPDLGYCEFDEPAHAWKFIQKWAEITQSYSQFINPAKQKNSLPIGFEIGICSLQELSNNYPVWKVLKDNQVEIINPLYSQPYLRHIGEESNLRQFLFGLNVLEKNGLECKVYSSSEHALHPQIPQLLHGFNIQLAFATSRLGGASPTSSCPKVIWIGRDKTEITAIVNQSGIPNGQTWHGKFFQELPHLLFSTYSRPDLKQVYLCNIEDLAYDFKEIPEIMNHIQEFERAQIHFRRFSDLKSEQIPVTRKVNWSIEEFPLHLLLNSRVIQANRLCEDYLINIESTCALLNTIGYSKSSQAFDEMWRELLIAQNHDAYVVPFTTPGMYMVLQGLATEYIQDPAQSIENQSLNIIGKINNQLNLLQDSFQKLNKIKSKPNPNPPQFAYLNWLWKRDVLIEDMVYHLPSIGYHAEYRKNPNIRDENLDGPWKFIKWEPKRKFLHFITKLIQINVDTQKLVNKNPENIPNPIRSTLTNNPNTTIELHDCFAYLQIKINTNKQFEFILDDCQFLEITYPFGLEPSSEHFGHCLRFFWINHEYILIHTGCPFYIHENNTLQIRIPKGNSTFALAYARTYKKAFQIAWEFYYPPVKFTFSHSFPLIWSFFTHELNDFIPISIRKHPKGILIRGFTVGNTLPHFPDSKITDFFDHEIKFKNNLEKGKYFAENSRAWRILTYLVKSNSFS